MLLHVGAMWRCPFVAALFICGDVLESGREQGPTKAGACGPPGCRFDFGDPLCAVVDRDIYYYYHYDYHYHYHY